MPKDVRRSPEQWQVIIAEYERSGLSRRDFCAARKLNAEYFRRRLQAVKRSTSRQPAFVPVRVRGDGIAIEIGDVTVRCTTAIPVSWIADLATALRR